MTNGTGMESDREREKAGDINGFRRLESACAPRIVCTIPVGVAHLAFGAFLSFNHNRYQAVFMAANNTMKSKSAARVAASSAMTFNGTIGMVF